MPTERAVLEALCLCLSKEPAVRNQVVAALSDPEMRPAVMQLARQEGVLPAFSDAIASCARCLPKPERMPLAIDVELNRRRNHQIADAIVELASEANRESIEIVPLKGAMWVLEDPGDCAAWRAMGDADVLVSANQLAKIQEVLARLGYRAARRERNLLGKRRFEGHYHLVQYRRGDAPFVFEVHRDIGWRPMLLPTEAIFDSRRRIAPGLSLPCPWHAAVHAIVHWQIHHYGYQRGIPIQQGVEITRFLQRNDMEWEAMAHHVARVGIVREVDAAFAVAERLFACRAPELLRPSPAGFAYVSRALQIRTSRIRMLAGKQQMRLLRAWEGDRLLYRLGVRQVPPSTARALLWAVRVRRTPFVVFHLISIALLNAIAWTRSSLAQLLRPTDR